MSNEQLPLHFDEPYLTGFITEGCEKRVFKVIEGGNPYAVKIFKKNRPGNDTVDVEGEARRELEAYETFRKTPLRDYIPQPVRLFRGGNGEVSGLVVEWRDGVSLDSSHKLIKASQLSDLEKALLTLPKFGVIPNIDMYSEGNIMVSENGLWLAECRNVPSYLDKEDLYRQSVSNSMRYLQAHFVEV